MSKKDNKSYALAHERGEIKANYLAALVTSKAFKTQVVKAKKGKGSFKRKAKHQGREPYLMAA
ncbi:alternative ribosome rescue factor ArfA [Thalassotalea sediminis]|uniref:alternative ribosome rescue factor ArfA n=1 Tax=Thalassotalea sediminis TaxID=1759089 RepID=UPI002573F04B|nr:alternative ribosome rescue factor ArfA [Thalassotalea sediminis]